VKSKITSKFQITIPREIRKRLKLSRHDSIEWITEDGKIFIKQADAAFLKLRGSINVGDGNIDDDIEKAKKLRANIING